jgi:hypothetical protein
LFIVIGPRRFTPVRVCLAKRLATAMPAGISPRGDAQKCPVLLAKINSTQKHHHGKVCCNLRREENFRQQCGRENKMVGATGFEDSGNFELRFVVASAGNVYNVSAGSGQPCA